MTVGNHKPLDIGARRVMGAQFVPLDRIEGPFEQRAEDGGLDLVQSAPAASCSSPISSRRKRERVGREETRR